MNFSNVLFIKYSHTFLNPGGENDEKNKCTVEPKDIHLDLNYDDRMDFAGSTSCGC
ncbi:hypothetical protein J15TS10_01540 [Paenibacillus woosongensis]|uniref:Uncharacterized protein n=1 Tax=Paenibacillus woosongensis TaxID=307580 RepID=A0ABQ4MK29_9BACL|nr:hypothetical protein J15TS10_01540 [Paenibacillus woosongensis]